jgi:putative redox protein
MKIEITRLNKAFWMEATNEQGATLQMDANPEIGGGDQGFRPMQMLLAALGGCSTIDILLILQKQRQEVEDIRITVEGEREAVGEVNIFRNINIHYTVVGKVDAKKVEKAIALSMEKYCSVAKTLEPTATMTTSFEILNA